jgi:hypothetical protein
MVCTAIRGHPLAAKGGEAGNQHRISRLFVAFSPDPAVTRTDNPEPPLSSFPSHSRARRVVGEQEVVTSSLLSGGLPLMASCPVLDVALERPAGAIGAAYRANLTPLTSVDGWCTIQTAHVLHVSHASLLRQSGAHRTPMLNRSDGPSSPRRTRQGAPFRRFLPSCAGRVPDELVVGPDIAVNGRSRESRNLGLSGVVKGLAGRWRTQECTRGRGGEFAESSDRRRRRVAGLGQG